MSAGETRVCDAAELSQRLRALAVAIARERRPGVPLRLVGVRTRGVPIAERLAAHLRALTGEEILVGAVDVTLYRDDLGQRERWPVLLGTEIPFDVEGAEVVLVDDVLFTGRTVRAALNAVCDLGRPARVALAAVVDRGGRELPIQTDYTGLTLTADPSERVLVRISPPDEREGVFRLRTAPEGAIP
jgi:pyrimidine operon attenuation protein/uracil phosphoribosyltransferase